MSSTIVLFKVWLTGHMPLEGNAYLLNFQNDVMTRPALSSIPCLIYKCLGTLQEDISHEIYLMYPTELLWEILHAS